MTKKAFSHEARTGNVTICTFYSVTFSHKDSSALPEVTKSPSSHRPRSFWFGSQHRSRRLAVWAPSSPHSPHHDLHNCWAPRCPSN